MGMIEGVISDHIWWIFCQHVSLWGHHPSFAYESLATFKLNYDFFTCFWENSSLVEFPTQSFPNNSLPLSQLVCAAGGFDSELWSILCGRLLVCSSCFWVGSLCGSMGITTAIHSPFGKNQLSWEMNMIVNGCLSHSLQSMSESPDQPILD